MTHIKLNISGVHCKSCKMLIEGELEDLGATNIKVVIDESAQKGTIECETNKSKEEVVKAIEALGEYKVK